MTQTFTRRRTDSTNDLNRRRFLHGASSLLALGVAGNGRRAALAQTGGTPSPAATPSGTRKIEHAFGTTEVPANPQRVVTLQDQNALLPLWEFGFRNVVGSVGAFDENGQPYFRRMQDFDTSSIQFVGLYGEPDLEAVVALTPDLIVAPPFQQQLSGQLNQIAPTVFIDTFNAPIAEVMMRFARLVGLEEEAARLDGEHQVRLDALRSSVGDPAQVVISVITTAASGGTDPGQFYIEGPRGGSVEDVLNTIGFARPIEQITVEERTYLSVEQLPTQDADLLLRLTFRQDAGNEDENTRAVKESALWSLLNAVRKDQAHDIDGEDTIGTGYTPRFKFVDVLAGLLEGLDTSGELPEVEVGTP